MDTSPNPTPDPRTRQFLEVLAVIALIGGVHAASFFLAVQSGNLFTSSYETWIFIVLPAFATMAAVTLAVSRRWHWGQAILLIIATFVTTFIQAAIMGEASASA